MQNKSVLSVSQINKYINGIFQAEELLHNIAVTGEISGFKISAGNAYFKVKDENAALNCVCFSVSKTYIPKDGESVLLSGTVTYYAKGGTLNFNVSTIAPLGQGALSAKFEALKQKLISEGIFDEAHKKAIPQFPINVGVITSKTGAVIRDIQKTVFKNNPKANISVFDVRVQGENAANEIVEAINFADSLGFDVIIIARGGGSFEDLLPFYDENLAKAVYNMKTPVISAVGHETDVSFCDFAADLRVPTPTAAGEAASFNLAELKGKIVDAEKFIYSRVNENYKDLLNSVISQLNFVRLYSESFISKQNAVINIYLNKIFVSVSNCVSAKENALNSVCAKISQHNPLNILNKGAFFAYKDEKRITNDEEIAVGDKVRFVGKNKNVDVTVDNITKR